MEKGKNFPDDWPKILVSIAKTAFYISKRAFRRKIFWDEISKKINWAKKFRIFVRILKVFSGLSEQHSTLPEDQLTGKRFFWVNFFWIFIFKLWGWSFVFLPQTVGRLSKRVRKNIPRKTFLWTRKQEKKMNMCDMFPDFWHKNFVGNFKIEIYVSRGAFSGNTFLGTIFYFINDFVPGAEKVSHSWQFLSNFFQNSSYLFRWTIWEEFLSEDVSVIVFIFFWDVDRKISDNWPKNLSRVCKLQSACLKKIPRKNLPIFL